MNTHIRPEIALRRAAALLLSLPAIVATACFAHGHGALGSGALLAVLAVSSAAGAWGAYGLLVLLRLFSPEPSARVAVRVRNSNLPR